MSGGVWSSVRHWLAAGLLDAPRYRRALRAQQAGKDRAEAGWVSLCNRGERLRRLPGQRGVRCEWRWTSALFYPQARPEVARALLDRALADWPIEFASEPAWPTGPPRVSFVIGHRGAERLTHLLTAVATIAAQREVSCEVLVVEQALTAHLPAHLPGWIRHLHTPPPGRDLPYSRAWAFNCGALAARADVLVFHDNDVCVPRDYAREILAVLEGGFEAARLQRFVFHLTQPASEALMRTRSLGSETQPELVVQNCEGHTLAVRRDVYLDLGGHDETFRGWGGEDNEMFDRLRTRRLHDHTYLPFLHLHHAPQPGKLAALHSQAYLEERLRVPAAARVDELRRRPMGRASGPFQPDASQ